jgi:hypothetical protein
LKERRLLRFRRDDSLANQPIGDYTRQIGTIEHFRWLKGIIGATLILNLLDAIFTIIVVVSKRAREANPLMADLLESPWLFMFVKLGLVSLGSYLLWRLRKRKLAVLAIFVAFMVYYFVLLYHLNAMDLHLLSRLS